MATLQQKIMRRVWAIFLFRKVTSAPALRLYTLAFLAFESAELFNVRDIIANMPSIAESGRFIAFSLDAFLNTEFVAQTVLAGIITIGGFSAWRTLRYITRSLRPATVGQYA
jgi:hypothetical protein